MNHLHVLLSGRVQGVGFRWFAREEARRLGLAGWVTNRPTGEVEVAASGTTSSLDRLRRALLVGPAGAQVERIIEVEGPVESPLPYPFTIHR